jgi:hypothetical protein
MCGSRAQRSGGFAPCRWPIAVFTPNGTNPSNVFYIHNDHLGAPQAIVNTATGRWIAPLMPAR